MDVNEEVKFCSFVKIKKKLWGGGWGGGGGRGAGGGW